ncbi:hypothetical protein ACLOJK_008435 [Asimina triloba]
MSVATDAKATAIIKDGFGKRRNFVETRPPSASDTLREKKPKPTHLPSSHHKIQSSSPSPLTHSIDRTPHPSSPSPLIEHPTPPHLLYLRFPMGKLWFRKKAKREDSRPRPWKFSFPAWKWKRLEFQLSLLDDVLFKVVSVFEAIVLVSTLCFFYLCCGCHF